MPESVQDTVDFIVVGAGSAGAAVAARLSERDGVGVVVLEAGSADKDKFIRIPAGFSKLFQGANDWNYRTEPQAALGGRRVYWPRGKMLGGSSAMNAMMWVRGFAADYDDWARAAGPAWSFQEVLPHFRRMEHVEGASGDEEGGDGPLHISRQRSPRPLTRDFLVAATEAGYAVERANSAVPQGFSETMVTQKRGARWSTADAYLRPALRRRRGLEVRTDAHVTRILFEGERAVGVEYRRDGRTHRLRARREVILSGGAINTPQLLMLSGVGDREQLSGLGIPVVHHSPEVGRNLRDHLVAPIVYRTRAGSLFTAERIPELVNYLLRRRGMLTSNVGEAYGFVRSRDELELPDLELIFGPAPYVGEGLLEPVGHAITLGAILLRPASSGTITLGSADPFTAPRIDPRYCTDPEGLDRAALLAGLRKCVDLAHMPALKQHIGDLMQPDVPADTPTDEILRRCLEDHSHTLYHPVGTCRMSADDTGVVDPELRVRGLRGLRIADTSVMPIIIRGHTHAPAVLIGEKAADLITR
ncbi:Alcohol dehydrogenase [acceptor] [Nocardia otitidiscaviarum]|uniref:Alcohol dehydrogenase [acceptor] n=1 Tax=Nocardia otitidiscaviarum TaxID=1823 RepID=A0A378YDV7_9NOCA|nr:GMC family oxidoreductase N-terminal domain-containing protein [Nocardia otitidiscaviarum]SUA74903.1 Alcohol dehydrogenase [acceptor] [Nocardia otitidiscaviarum]